MKAAVQANTELLLFFGAAQTGDTRRGIAPRIHRLFRSVAERISRQPALLSEYLPQLEFVAQRFAPAWLLVADLHEETEGTGALEGAKRAIRRYLELPSDGVATRSAWERLAALCKRTGDFIGEVHALVELSALPTVPVQAVSNAVNRWNSLFRHQHIPLAGDERRILAERLLTIAERRKDEVDSIDCSRIAWLSLALHKDSLAKEFTALGLALDPQNEHCRNLAERLNLPLTTGFSRDRHIL